MDHGCILRHIGEALVYELARKGAKLIVSARRKSELERVRSNCPGSLQENIYALPLDLAEPETLKSAVEKVLKNIGNVHILINNGGISQRALAAETDTTVDRKLMEVNYFGAVELTKFLLPHFKENGGGQIVVVSSLVGKFGTPYRSGYSASKHALHGFFDSLRAEVHGDNIKISMICPGFIHTNVSINALTGNGEKLNEMDNAQASGMPADKFARKMVSAIESGKEEVNIGGKEKFAVLLKRFLPGLFNKAVRKAKVR